MNNTGRCKFSCAPVFFNFMGCCKLSQGDVRKWLNYGGY